jgi:hypothetical protein
MYKDADRELRIEQILSVAGLGLPPRIVETTAGPEEQPPFITGLAVAPDASEMLVSVCVDGPCGSVPHTGPSQGRVAIFESTDGGVTWRELGHDYDPTLRLAGYIAPGVALVSQNVFDTFEIVYFRFPDFEPLQHEKSHRPVLSFDGDVVWGTKGGSLLDESGGTFLDLGPYVFAGPRTVTHSDTGGLLPLSWFRDDPESHDSRHFLSLVNADGDVVETYETSPVSNDMLTAIPFADGRVAGTMMVDRRQILGAVQTGPFARVVNTGSCLNVRADAGLEWRIKACVADHVLLRSTGLTQTVDGIDWLSVAMPSGDHGWAAAEFLEY